MTTIYQHITDAPLRPSVLEGVTVIANGSAVGRFIFRDRPPLVEAIAPCRLENCTFIGMLDYAS